MQVNQYSLPVHHHVFGIKLTAAVFHKTNDPFSQLVEAFLSKKFEMNI